MCVERGPGFALHVPLRSAVKLTGLTRARQFPNPRVVVAELTPSDCTATKPATNWNSTEFDHIMRVSPLPPKPPPHPLARTASDSCVASSPTGLHGVSAERDDPPPAPSRPALSFCAAS